MSLSITDKPAFTRSGYASDFRSAGRPDRHRPASLRHDHGLGRFRRIYAVLQPNESALLILFGSYRGTDAATGLRWANPFFAVRRVSRRLQTHHLEEIKANDASGNPIEIGAAIVWHFFDAAKALKALLEVDYYKTFVAMQSETALRKVVSSHPYDHWQDVRDGGEEITERLIAERRGQLTRAGIEVTEARTTHLAYALEIASAMLRRKQTNAIVGRAAHDRQGAVDLVKEALVDLKDKSIEIDDERQAAMVSNMLIVLVGDKDATLVINIGTLYG